MNNFHEGMNIDKTIDFHITFDEGNQEYVVDIFDAQIADKDQAYIRTFECESLEEALEDAQNYKLMIAV